LKSSVPGILIEQQELISKMIKDVVIPKANGILNKMTMIDLMNTLSEAVSSPKKAAC
jgi:hypothetical protein